MTVPNMSRSAGARTARRLDAVPLQRDETEQPDGSPRAVLDPPPGFREAVRGDFARIASMKKTRYPSVYGLVDILGLPGTWAVLLFRVAVALHQRGLRPLSRLRYPPHGHFVS